MTGENPGIGRAVAIAFAREGADVAISYLPTGEADAKKVVKLIEASESKAVALLGDIQEEAFCRAMVEHAEKQLGGLDILVDNAGTMTSHEDLLHVSTADFDKTVKTNVYALFWITQAAIPFSSRARPLSTPRRSRQSAECQNR